jgi:hypothetical protein
MLASVIEMYPKSFGIFSNHFTNKNNDIKNVVDSNPPLSEE